ncbi:MAG: hypothetical protein WB586_10835 [Chthoniobacterales bacterium]
MKSNRAAMTGPTEPARPMVAAVLIKFLLSIGVIPPTSLGAPDGWCPALTAD